MTKKRIEILCRYVAHKQGIGNYCQMKVCYKNTFIHQAVNVNKQIKPNTYIEYIKYLHGQLAEIKTIHHIHALRSKSHKHYILTTKRGFVRVPVCAQPWFRVFQPASNWIWVKGWTLKCKKCKWKHHETPMIHDATRTKPLPEYCIRLLPQCAYKNQKRVCALFLKTASLVNFWYYICDTEQHI